MELLIGGSLIFLSMFTVLYISNWFTLLGQGRGIFLIFLSVFPLLQDLVRYEFFAKSEFKLAFQMDAVWLITEVLLFFILISLNVHLSATMLILVWTITGTISFVLGYFRLRKIFIGTGSKLINSDLIFKNYKQFINGLIPLSGTVMNILLNLMLIRSGRIEELNNLRGTQILTSPVAFISNYQQLYWLKQQSHKKIKQVDKPARLMALIVGLSATLISITIFFPKLGFTIIPLAMIVGYESYLNFEISQVSYLFRANRKNSHFFLIRLIWFCSTLICVFVLVSLHIHFTVVFLASTLCLNSFISYSFVSYLRKFM